ncbi:hypothetical protein HELRODRAFT_101627 [Helobdella robusta]|uniref:Integrator complex subunit 4/Protein SIEL C-terminal Ig-like domain-containing protein n=1 Tax=Helobdella robusta TaxID=6412 RepID=T1ED60_HELRO|nr:hypothetical protein HELRODRAFT_101627 [Helobdella robusta]ESN98447.1 hypothetical protein HELRODRAFT_101627 [Helobdella robusta]
MQNLNHDSHNIRIKCLKLIGQLGNGNLVIGQSQKSMSLLDIIISSTQDFDWRVQLVAFEAILEWHKRGIEFDWLTYKCALTSLDDDHEGIRLVAMKIIWIIAQQHPHKFLLSNGNGSKKLIDDCFVNLCEFMNDSSPKVRTQAATLLGSMHGVSLQFLSQTLDKKLMSNMRRKTTSHERQKELFRSGEWSSGKKWGDDSPKECLDADSITIISGGACGAFVHGLEDEIAAVRNASIVSMGDLSCRHVDFSHMCHDFIVDMFNDEIDSVRLNAINSLAKMSRSIVMREEQLDIIVGVLKDFYAEIREAMHALLCCCRLATKSGMDSLVMSLLDNLTRYPEDRVSVWRVMKSLGENHPSLTLSLLPSLLSVHLYFETREHELDDPSYIGVLLMVSNAAPHCPTMPALLPQFIPHHFLHLKNMYPDLVPDNWFRHMKDLIPYNSIGRPFKNLEHSLANEKKIVLLIMSKLNVSRCPTNLSAMFSLVVEVIKDLKRVNQHTPMLQSTNYFSQLYLKCFVELVQSMNRQNSHTDVTKVNFRTTTTNNSNNNNSNNNEDMNNNFNGNVFDGETTTLTSVSPTIKKLVKMITAISNLAVSLSDEQNQELDRLSLIISAYHLSIIFTGLSNQQRSGACLAYLKLFNSYKDKWKVEGGSIFKCQKFELRNQATATTTTTTTDFIDNLSKECLTLQPCDATNCHRVLVSALRVFSSSFVSSSSSPSSLSSLFPFIMLDNPLRMTTASIVEPPASSDLNQTVMPNYTMGVRMVVKLWWVQQIGNVRIHVKYADGKEYLILPPLEHFKSVNSADLSYKLSTYAYINHQCWTEPCPVKLRIVYLCSTNYGKMIDDITSPKTSTSAAAEVVASAASRDDDEHDYIELSGVCTLSIHPSLLRDSSSSILNHQKPSNNNNYY